MGYSTAAMGSKVVFLMQVKPRPVVCFDLVAYTGIRQLSVHASTRTLAQPKSHP